MQFLGPEAIHQFIASALFHLQKLLRKKVLSHIFVVLGKNTETLKPKLRFWLQNNHFNMKEVQRALGTDERETLFIFVIIRVIPLESLHNWQPYMPLKICNKKMGSHRACFRRTYHFSLVAGKMFEKHKRPSKMFTMNLTKALSSSVCLWYDSSVKWLRNYPILRSREF